MWTARVLVSLALAAAPFAARAETLLTHPSLVNRTPGPDFHVGTADDAITAAPFGPNASGANVRGAASYVLLKQDGSMPVDGDDFDYILFFDGTMDLTLDPATSTATTIVMNITGGAIQATPEFTPGRVGGTLTDLAGNVIFTLGDASATAVLSGQFSDPAFMTAIMAQTAYAAPGNAVVVMRPFGSSGNTYVDGTLTPLVPADAGEIALIEFTGTANGVVGCCSTFGVRGVFALYGTAGAPGTTTTTLPGGGGGGGGCTTIPECGPAVDAALPPTNATDPKVRRTATKLGKLRDSATAKLGQAASATGKKQARLYRKGRTLLNKLLTKARTADQKARLGVPLAPLEAAVTALLAVIPG
jgi:hypothetical protein